MTVQVLGPRPSLWEKWMEFLAPGFGTELAMTGIWGVNEHMEDLSVSVSLPLSLRLSRR